MVVFWGTKRRDKKHGYAADFCPFCRQIEAVEVYEANEVEHIYLISMGKEEKMGYYAHCNNTHMDFGTTLDRYKNLETIKGIPLGDLIDKTLPSFNKYEIENQNLEMRVESGEVLKKNTRERLLFEKTNLLAFPFQVKLATPIMDMVSILFIVAAFLLPTLLMLIPEAMGIAKNTREVTTEPLAGVFLILFAGLHFHRNSKRRKAFLDETAYPVFAKLLAPLKPTLSEIKSQLQLAARGEFLLGKVIKPKRLLEEIEKVNGK